MFKSDVTQTYNQQDATLEILVMLAGAFILGCLLCWLLRKLFSKGDQASQNNSLNVGDTNARENTNRNPVANTKPQTLTSNRINTNGGTDKRQSSLVVKHDSAYNKPRIDDLTKISGINPDVQAELKDRGINSYIDLRDSDKQSIVDTLASPSGQATSTKEAQTWPHQASLAAKGEWEKLTEYQEFMKRTQKAAQKIEASQAKSNSSQKDDLKKIEGIGPKIEEILNKNGINTFKTLSNTDRDTIKKHLDDAGDRFKMHEPKSWPHQAGMADRGEWDELKLYQEFMDGGRDDIPSASASVSTSKKAASKKPELSAPTHFKSNLANQNDDLKKIEGIGPKIEELLNKADINTFEDLKDSDRNTIKSLLDKAGPQYRMHDPETWPEQAKLAFEGEWDKLKEYQDFLIGGRG